MIFRIVVHPSPGQGEYSTSHQSEAVAEALNGLLVEYRSLEEAQEDLVLRVLNSCPPPSQVLSQDELMVIARLVFTRTQGAAYDYLGFLWRLVEVPNCVLV